MDPKKFEKFNFISLGNADDEIEIAFEDFNLVIEDEEIDLLVYFCYDIDDIFKAGEKFDNIAKTKDAILYLAFPKKTSKKYSASIGRDSFFETIDGKKQFLELPNVKFGSLISISEDFSAFILRQTN